MSGHVFLIDGSMVSWLSKKQELVTLSTAKAEYVVATHAAKEALWLRQFIGEVFRPLSKLITIWSDSLPAITLMSDADGSFHARTKHIDLRYHFICYTVQEGKIKLIYCPTDDMVANTLTKALPSLKAKHFTRALRLRGP